MKFHSAIGTINQNCTVFPLVIAVFPFRRIAVSTYSRFAVFPYSHITVFLVPGFWLPFFLFSTLYTPPLCVAP
jgi:hypothetical protein